MIWIVILAPIAFQFYLIYEFYRGDFGMCDDMGKAAVFGALSLLNMVPLTGSAVFTIAMIRWAVA